MAAWMQHLQPALCGRRGLVYDAQHSQGRNDAGVFGRLALCGIEVGWHRNNVVSNRLALVGVGRRFYLRQHHRAHLLLCEAFALPIHLSHQLGLAILANHREWLVPRVLLDLGWLSLRPINRSASGKVFFLDSWRTWFLDASPIRRSVSVNAMYDGVVRLPRSLAIVSTFQC